MSNIAPRIAVLITCYNRVQQTITCLNKLFNQKGIDQEFIISCYLVDDGSSDNTSVEVKRKYPQVNLIMGNGDLYWNRGMNLAWKTAANDLEYDFFLWLNDDTFLFDDAIFELLNQIKKQKKKTMLCGSICSEEKIWTYGLKNKKGEQIYPNQSNLRGELANGNVVLIPKSIYDIVGMLDPVFPHAIGDYDYSLRVIKKGFDIITSEKFIGFCEKKEKLPDWCYSKHSIIKRIKSLYSPLGNSHPYYFFIYEKRHFGIHIAVKHLISIHMRLLMPGLWK